MSASDELPLKPEVFQILLRLLRGESHGYEIMRDVSESSGGEVRMLAGALYRHLARMTGDGLIRELDRRGEGDERRRYYAVTDYGREPGSNGLLIVQQAPGLDRPGPYHNRVIFSLDLTTADGLFSARNFPIRSEDAVLATESPVTAIETVLGLFGTAFGTVRRVTN